MADVVLEKVSKIYGNKFHAIKDLSLSIQDGEFLILVGPSGCGKSTALRMIAGLEDISDGDLKINGISVVDLPPKDRDIAMVFQNYALYPHMTVFENIAFSMRLAGKPKEERKRRVEQVAATLQLTSLLDSKPAMLSGGQRQRVAMGRAMVREPAAFLMDEPLSNLDAKLRVQMRAEIANLQRELGVTTIYVTHDQVEALTMGDRVAVMKDGFLQQVDTPKRLYQNPENVFVAGFIGSPSMNLFSGVLDGQVLKFGAVSIDLPPSVFVKNPALAAYNGRQLIFGIRPEDIYDAKASGNPDFATIPAYTASVEELGAEHIVHLDIQGAVRVDSGDPDAVSDLGTASNTVARFDAKSPVTAGEMQTLALDCEMLHFFDAESLTAIARSAAKPQHSTPSAVK